MTRTLIGRPRSLVLLAWTSFVPSLSAQTGKIVVNSDEWTLSDRGFSGLNDPGVFGVNVCDWFTGGGLGSFLAYTNNYGLTGSQINSAITGAGHSWTVRTGGGLSLAQMRTYDGIFLGGIVSPAPSTGDLIDYVNGGGNVYVMGGTGDGGPIVEAGLWNPFLNTFGLGYAASYNGIDGDIPVRNTHPIFAGVDSLLQRYGQDVLDLQPGNPKNQILVDKNGHGLYGVYTPVPWVAMRVSSSFPAEAAPVEGTLNQQIARLNGGPAGAEWQPARAKLDDNRASSFVCGEPVPPNPRDPLTEPFVSTNSPIPGVHEVTLDNCRSAFYRFTFLMPPTFSNAAISGTANADDIGIVFLNGVAISPAMRASDLCLPNGCDRCDQGPCVLTWPFADVFGTVESGLFRPGVNELVFGICGDASPHEPTGLEFEAIVTYSGVKCYADCDPSGEPGTLDIFDFLCFQNRYDAADPYACDCDTSSGLGVCDIFDFLCFQNAYDAGCP